MIKKLQNKNIEIAYQIHTVYQLSYGVEAKLLGATDFPPLKRPISSYLESDNMFFGYFEGSEIAGILEIELSDLAIEINSLVVSPSFFRRGIARKLLAFIFEGLDSNLIKVETGVKNQPATELYKKLGFKEVKQWDTDFGIRKVLFEKRMDNTG